ncbi:MAG TPA: hypothetical protein VMV43_01290 [Candidatus Nanopelagicaceae bacterium]|nr:hypothetical protein [Candidatus Nanopelagicaceae bacterium]
MEVKLNNCELVAVLSGIENYLDYTDDPMVIASLKSFVNKVSDEIRTFNRKPDELTVQLLGQLEEIEDFVIPLMEVE